MMWKLELQSVELPSVQAPYSGKIVFIIGAHGRSLGASGMHEVYLSANKLGWEKWRIEDAGDGHVFIIGAHGRSLGASGMHEVYLSANKPGWEKWRIEDAGDGHVFIIGAHGHSLGAS